MASSGSFGSDFTIPRVDGGGKAVKKASGQGGGWEGGAGEGRRGLSPACRLWTLVGQGWLGTTVSNCVAESRQTYFEATLWGPLSEEKSDPNSPSLHPT